MDRPANNEMVCGFRDGYDMSNPWPGENRSRSYRHGFFVARIDKGEVKAVYQIAELRRMADTAMTLDEDPAAALVNEHSI